MTSRVVAKVTLYHLEQLLFSKLCCILLLSWSRTQGSLCSSWSCGGQERLMMTSMMVPNMFFGHLEQLLFSKHWSKKLYLEIAVKFSSQEHGRPPRIQEEKSGLDTKKSKSRLDFDRKQLPTQYWTSKKLRNGPEIMLFQPILEGKFSNIFDKCAVCVAWTWGAQNFFGTPQTYLEAFGMISRPGIQNTQVGRQIPAAL